MRSARSYALASHGMSWSTDGSSTDGGNRLSTIFPYPALTVFERGGEVLSAAFGYFESHHLSVTVANSTDSLLGEFVSGSYFQGMGVAPSAGRLIQPADDQLVNAPVVVVSYRFSLAQFGDPQAALGQTIHVDNQPFTIVGVAPEGFFGAEPGAVPDVYLPLQASPMSRAYRSDEHFYWLEVMGRLKPGVSREQAQARLAPAFGQFVAASAITSRQKADLPQLRIEEGSMGLDSLRRKYARPIYVLMTMVILILVIASVSNAVFGIPLTAEAASPVYNLKPAKDFGR